MGFDSKNKIDADELVAIFDSKHYIEINKARWNAAKDILRIIGANKVDSCYDLGCGPGWFSSQLLNFGVAKLVGLEGRNDLVDIASKRVPEAFFYQCNIDEPLDACKYSPADLVFCFGLLYHLENPFCAIRNIRKITKRYCLIESIIIPDEHPSYCLVQESNNINQGVSHYAVIPSLPAITKMLYASGFLNVYLCTTKVEHRDFEENDQMFQRRRILLATDKDIHHDDLKKIPVPEAPKYSFKK